MGNVFDRPVIIQKIDEATEKWADVWRVHARINKAKDNSEYMGAGAIQNKQTLTFEIRFFSAVKDIRLNCQSYRVIYDGVPYNLEDYDDYMEQHRTVKLLGVSY